MKEHGEQVIGHKQVFSCTQDYFFGNFIFRFEQVMSLRTLWCCGGKRRKRRETKQFKKMNGAIKMAKPSRDCNTYNGPFQILRSATRFVELYCSFLQA
jgi:hypothetical protein